MTLPHGPAARPFVEAIDTLIRSGSCAATAIAPLPSGHDAGWWSVDGGTAVATPRLLAVIDAVPAVTEAAGPGVPISTVMVEEAPSTETSSVP